MARAARQAICAIAVMAKAPQPGRAKTRLVPPLSPEAAAALSLAFLRDIAANLTLAASGAPIRGGIAYAPAGGGAALRPLLPPGGFLVLADGSGGAAAGVEGFGRCLLHAVRAVLAHVGGTVCLLNSDSPTLPTVLLRQAAEALAAAGERVVLGPAEDGGYYLIGMKSAHPTLFANIDWSTGAVAEQTRARARQAGLDLIELAPWYDVDDGASLRRLVDPPGPAPRPAPCAGGLAPFPAPATSACIGEWHLRELLARAA
jgi:rSAM/selenodomain-associated transferase 1